MNDLSRSRMQVPVQITFNQLEHSPDLEQKIQAKVAKLEAIHAGIISCRVVVQPAAHPHGAATPMFSVRFELGLGGGKIIIGGGPGTQNDEFDSVHAALKASFEATRRQLHDHIEKERQFAPTPLGPQ